MTASTSISREREPTVADRQARNDLEPFRERRGLGSVVRLEIADDDVAALVLRLLSLLEHPVGLADAGDGAEQDPVAAPRHALTRPRRLCTTRSISLMPTKGRIIPPSP